MVERLERLESVFLPNLTWHPIISAPKNDGAIYVAHDEVGAFVVIWDEDADNPLFCGDQVGLWAAIDKSMTWGTDDAGPDKWAYLVDEG